MIPAGIEYEFVFAAPTCSMTRLGEWIPGNTTEVVEIVSWRYSRIDFMYLVGPIGYHVHGRRWLKKRFDIKFVFTQESVYCGTVK